MMIIEWKGSQKGRPALKDCDGQTDVTEEKSLDRKHQKAEVFKDS